MNKLDTTCQLSFKKQSVEQTRWCMHANGNCIANHVSVLYSVLPVLLPPLPPLLLMVVVDVVTG